MRARQIKPGLFKNEILGAADPLLTILFEGLWCSADRNGVLEDRALRICAEVFPYRRRVTEKRCDAMLQWLNDQNFIARYISDGVRLIQVLEFDKHQNPHKDEKPSGFPQLSAIQHGASTGAAPVSAQCPPGKSTESIGLIPSSLTPSSLTEDRGLLTEDCRTPVRPPTNGHSHPGQQPAEFQQIKAAYPKGTYLKSAWAAAEHHACHRVEEGTATWHELLAGVVRYRVQCDAKGSTGTQFVLNPAKFFELHTATWRDEFPLPVQTSASRKTYADYDRESADSLAALPGVDPGPM